MKTLTTALAILIATWGTAYAQPTKPTIVLVHGAFADSSSWNGVIDILESDGYSVMAVANPLRGVKSDANYVADVLAHLGSRVVLVGHSYGGSVISEAVGEQSNVVALVFVAAFAPDEGETAAGLSTKFPGSTLGPALAPPVRLSNGGTDLYIQQDKFADQFAADLGAHQARLMSAAQRPIAAEALNEPQTTTAWKSVPAWFVYGDQDKNIPAEVLAFMATRARSRDTVVVEGASHAVMVSNPAAVARLIEKAAEGASR